MLRLPGGPEVGKAHPLLLRVRNDVVGLPFVGPSVHPFRGAPLGGLSAEPGPKKESDELSFDLRSLPCRYHCRCRNLCTRTRTHVHTKRSRGKEQERKRGREEERRRFRSDGAPKRQGFADLRANRAGEIG
jgi:hypothetical protein